MRHLAAALLKSTVVLLLCALPKVAVAGGLGLVGTAGLHGDRVYPYALKDNGEYVQLTPQDQLNSNFGGGLEVVLGDRDNKILGLFRAYYLQDAPQQEPHGQPGYGKDDLIYAVRDTPRDLGVIHAGLQFGFLGEPDNLMLSVVNSIGSGLYTVDLTQYAMAEVGLGGTWMANRHAQVHASVLGGVRYRKRFYPTANAYVGVRYLFD